MFNNGLSLADIAAVTGGRNNDGFNNGDGWWAWILMFALFGWGGFGGGWGNGWGTNGQQFTQADMQRGFDTQNILGSLRGIEQGLCSLGYDQLGQFNNLGNLVTQSGWNVERAINADTIANMQNQFALSRQIADCCCENRQQMAQMKYDMATSDCSIKTLMNQLFQQLQWGQQTGIRDLMDLINNKFCDLEMSQKNQIIEDLRLQLNNSNRDNALEALYNRLTATLDPRPSPAYPACNPHGVGNWSPNVLSGNGWSNGCGCNFNNNCCN